MSEEKDIKWHLIAIGIIVGIVMGYFMGTMNAVDNTEIQLENKTLTAQINTIIQEKDNLYLKLTEKQENETYIVKLKENAKRLHKNKK